MPAIPAGANTVWTLFRTADGLPAVVINQSGFARILEEFVIQMLEL